MPSGWGSIIRRGCALALGWLLLEVLSLCPECAGGGWDCPVCKGGSLKSRVGSRRTRRQWWVRFEKGLR